MEVGSARGSVVMGYQEHLGSLQVGRPPPHLPNIRLILEWTERLVSSALPTLRHTFLSPSRPRPTIPQAKQTWMLSCGTNFTPDVCDWEIITCQVCVFEVCLIQMGTEYLHMFV